MAKLLDSETLTITLPGQPPDEPPPDEMEDEMEERKWLPWAIAGGAVLVMVAVVAGIRKAR